MALIKQKLTYDQARRFFAVPRQRNLGFGQTILSQDLDFSREIHLWCVEFLEEGASPYWDVSSQAYFILFKNERDVVNFKLHWW
jgi:hypothetical protein